jgi:class I fructose-bisphosphate aldolase
MKRNSQASPSSALAELSLSHGKRARLWRLLYGHGPRNGSLVVLPLDQGLEHGPTDFFPNPPAIDPDYQFRLALEGNYSAIALGIGLAEKYMRDYAGRVPLILKLNGKTNIPDDAQATSPAFATVEDAVRLGADAVGYTIYVERLGMPLVLWSYPRGAGIDAKGGKGTLYAQDYAARVALELGADIVKLHEPEENNANSPTPYRTLRENAAARTQRVVRSAGRTMVLFSGGVKNDDDAAVLRKVKLYMDSGATGVMFGRNMWLRPFDEAVALSRAVHKIMAKFPH